MASPAQPGGAWGDYDNDGYPDLLLTSVPSGHWPLLLHNNGDLTFADVSGTMGFPTTAVEQDGAAWADYDNDGLLDVMVGSGGTGLDALYHRAGSTFTDVATAAGLNASARPARSISWCDYNGDGLLDVFVCKVFALSSLFGNDGDGTFTDVTALAGLSGEADPTLAVGSAWGDYDKDGHPDLVVTRDAAATRLYHNSGDGTFTEVSETAGLAAAVDGQGVAWADYDNDGRLDCYLAGR